MRANTLVSDKPSVHELMSDLLPGGEEDRFSDPVEARKKAMDYLARREHGRVELVKKLTKFGFEPNTSEDAIGQLIEDGLQSDQRFVDAFIQSRINQGKGPSRIRTELRERGLNGSDIDNGMADAGQDWFVLAAEVRRKKFGSGRPADFSMKARQMRFLQYRGFEQDHIQAAISADNE